MNKRNLSFVQRLNDRSKFPLVDNKLLSKELLESDELSVPKTLGVVSRPNEIMPMIEHLKELKQFVAKPAQGFGGKGILIIKDFDGTNFIKASGSPYKPSSLKKHFSNTLNGLYSLGGRTDVSLLEEVIQFDPVFARYSFEGVPDIRVIVYKGVPIMAMVRCPTKESDGKANLHQGAVGVGIDMKTGQAISAVHHNHEVEQHPDTEAKFSELAIDNWPELLRLSARCYDLTGLGYLGCDFVLNEKSKPVLLEMNARPGLAIQIANNLGFYHRVKLVEKNEEDLNTLEQRLALIQSF